MLEMKLHTSSTVQFEIPSWSFGLSLSDLRGAEGRFGQFGLLLVEGVLSLGLLGGRAAAERSNGEDDSGLLTFFSKLCNINIWNGNPRYLCFQFFFYTRMRNTEVNSSLILTWSSASFAVRTIAKSVCVVDISIKGGNIAAPAKGCNTGNSFFLLSLSLLIEVFTVDMRLGNGDGLNLGSVGGGKPFLTALK